MLNLHDDQHLWRRIDAATSASLGWFDAMQVQDGVRGVTRLSANHDAERWPGVQLSGTYNATLCRALLGDLENWNTAEKNALADWLMDFRRADGIFRLPGMSDDTVFKKPDLPETWRYIDFHLTNYAQGAIAVLTPEARAEVSFISPFLDPDYLRAWLDQRDMRDPWQEGNNIVNLASFLQVLAKNGSGEESEAVANAVGIILDWLDQYQDPKTGFWGVGNGNDPKQLLHAMAGAMHSFHIWYALGRDLKHQDKAVDYVLGRPTTLHSACIDVDEVDLLVHAYDAIDYRRDEIEIWLREKLVSLLDFQNSDGGFSDEEVGQLKLDGWVHGYREPQGFSNGFATWFRWIAIAMIDDVLWPGRRQWHFRDMIGIGYRGRAR